MMGAAAEVQVEWRAKRDVLCCAFSKVVVESVTYSRLLLYEFIYVDVTLIRWTRVSSLAFRPNAMMSKLFSFNLNVYFCCALF